MTTVPSDASDEQGGLDLEALRRRRWLKAYERCRLGVKTAPGERDLPPAEADAEHFSFLRDLSAPDYLDRLTDRAERPLYHKRRNDLADRGLDPELSREERRAAAWAALARAWDRITQKRSPWPWNYALNETATVVVEVDAPAVKPEAEHRIRAHLQERRRDPPDVWAEEVARSELLRAAMDELGAAERKTVEMFYFDDLSASEIADQMGVAEGTVYSRLHRARDELEERLRDAV